VAVSRDAGAGSPGRGVGTSGLLEGRELSKRFVAGGEVVQALGSVSLRIDDGEFVAILGPSGCGKSTLLSILSGLEEATSGELSFAGSDVDGPLTEMGFVFQRDLLLDWRTALENVLMQYELRGQSPRPHEDRARELLDTVGLSGFADSYPWQLSGGMRQRVAICRALVHEPRVLLMDEPFGAVDALTRERLNVELSALCSGPPSKTVVFVTHDIDEAVFLADRIVVMSSRPGRIVEEVPVPLPSPRTNELRQTTAFMEQVARVRAHLLRDGVLG
jgi:NitT/TauT family transport system ATP-binding protein